MEFLVAGLKANEPDWYDPALMPKDGGVKLVSFYLAA
jgi:hypothetical protein